MFTKEQAAYYLAAMIDGEGWVGEPKGSTNRGVRIANTDPVLIAAIVEACDVLGIEHRVYAYARKQPGWSDGQTVYIEKEEALRIVSAEVPFRAERKRDRLARTLDSYRPRADVDTVRRLYAEGLTVGEIAARFGYSHGGMMKFARRHGVELARPGTEEHLRRVWRRRREESRRRSDGEGQGEAQGEPEVTAEPGHV